MHQLKQSGPRLSQPEMAQIGCLQLDRSRSFIKINIRYSRFLLHFTLQFLFVLLAGLYPWGKARSQSAWEFIWQ